MNYEELMNLIEQVDQSTLDYVDYETSSHHVVLSREVPQGPFKQDIRDVVTPTNEQATEPVAVAKELTEESLEKAVEKPGEIVKSPMVGVAYLKPHPDEASYVKVGDRVEQGEVICIVEVMKLMNEIQAPYSGVITEILIQNEEVVEYDQPLMRIEEG